MKRIKWGKVLLLIIMLGCIGVLLHDAYMITIKFASFTMFGIFTNIMCLATGIMIYDYLFVEEINIKKED